MNIKEKKCNCCGKIHTSISEDFNLIALEDAFWGVYFDCECESTLMLRDARIVATLSYTEFKLKEMKALRLKESA